MNAIKNILVKLKIFHGGYKYWLSLAVKVLLLVWLLAQVSMIGYYNFCRQKLNIDYDSAKLYVHAVEICKHNSFIIDGWTYTTTAEFDSSLLFAVPFYKCFGDIYIAFAWSNMIFVALWIWTVFRLFRKAGYSSEYPLLALNMILIPYHRGMLEYFNMMFFNGGQYVVKALCPLMLLSLLIDRGKEKTKAGKIETVVFAAIYAFFMFLTVFSSGMYVVICAVLPITVAILYHELKNEDRLRLNTAVWLLLTAGMILLGYALNRHFHIDAKGGHMWLNVGVTGAQTNAAGCFWGIFGLLGAIADQRYEIMSYDGVKTVARIFLALALILCATRALIRALRHQLGLFEKLLLGCFLWNTFIVCVCHTVDSWGKCHYRYHIIGVIPLMCLTIVYIVDHIKKEQKLFRAAEAVIGLSVLGFCAFTANRAMAKYRYEFDDLKMLCQYVNSEEIRKVYIYQHEDFAEDCRLIDYKNNDAVYYSVNESGYTFGVVDYYTMYDKQYIELENAVLVIDEATEDVVEMFGHAYRRIAQLGYLGVYQ